MVKSCDGEPQIFPLAVVGLNFTRLSLDSLREGGLNKLCNKNDNVLETLNEFYVAVFFYFYRTW